MIVSFQTCAADEGIALRPEGAGHSNSLVWSGLKAAEGQVSVQKKREV